MTGPDPSPARPARPPRPGARLATTVVVAAALAACATPEPEKPRRELPHRLVEGVPMYDVLPRDGIPSIDEPTYVDAETGDAFMAPDEPVIGFVGREGTAVAWSVWLLERHEIVNDEIDGEPLAASW